MNRVGALAASGLILTACGGSSIPATTVAQTDRPSASTSEGLPRQVQAEIVADEGPSVLVIGKDAVYVGAHRKGTVQRIDPSTNRVTESVAVGGQLQLEESTTTGGLAYVDADATALWTCTNTDGVLNQIRTHPLAVGVLVPAHCNGGTRTRIGDALWALPGGDSDEVLVLDVRTGRVLHRLSHEALGDGGPAVAAGGHVLIGSGASTTVLSATGEVLQMLPVQTPWLTSTGGRLYRMPEDGSLAELDPTTLAVRHAYVVAPHHDADPSLVADGSGHLYYRPDTTEVFRIDIASGNVRPFLTLPAGEVATSMAWGFGSLWITNFDDNTVWRVQP